MIASLAACPRAFAVLCAALAACGTSGIGAQERADLVITDVALFDALTGEIAENQSIVIDDGLIVAIHDAGTPVRASDSIDGRGRLAVPGLIDTHTHFQHQFHDKRVLQPEDRERLARVFLDHGVTTVGEMGQPPAWVPTMARWEDDESGPGPSIVLIAGSLISAHSWDTNPPPHHVTLRSPEEAQKQVRRYHDQGAERIKLYWKLETPEMIGAIAAADELGITPYAHTDNGIVTIDEAMDLGVRHFEHAFTLQPSIEKNDKLRAVLPEDMALPPTATTDEWTLGLSYFFYAMENDPRYRAKLDALLDRMAKNGASLSTALNIPATAAGQSPVFSLFDPKPPRSAPFMRSDFEPSKEASAKAFDAFLGVVVRAHEKGVTIRIGTDAGNGGEATLAEMMLLAQGGISVPEVLQIATINGARALGIDDRAGVIAPGRPADIVLFDEDPRLDPQAFLAGVTTFKRGQLHVPTASIAARMGDALRAKDSQTAEDIWRGRGKEALHPMEFYLETMALLKETNAEGARFLIDRFGASLDGEAAGDYFDPASLNGAAYGLHGQGQTEEGITLLKLALEFHPQDANLHDSLGELLAATGRREEAIESYERSLALNPDSASGKTALETLRRP
ncbi:MAG: amidohydrolase family protein [Parvularcula sp.]|jgi:imidazolonepropionase-like amidohydrolase|nr:amidohydrolase family protein [Parvularcula sp.]